MKPSERVDVLPWYRQSWPIFVFSLPAIAVVASFISLGLAVHNRDTLVSGDYYKQGLTVNERIERDEVAARGHIAANVTFRAEGSKSLVQVELTGHPELLDAGGAPVLKLMHPTDDLADLTIVLQKSAADNTWTGTSPSPSEKVAWQMSLENSLWRIGTDAAVHPGTPARLISLVSAES
ncbi:MAG: FixH family protein [Burkholderiaceae bacterium]|jgi:hypothetical protein